MRKLNTKVMINKKEYNLSTPIGFFKNVGIAETEFEKLNEWLNASGDNMIEALKWALFYGGKWETVEEMVKEISQNQLERATGCFYALNDALIESLPLERKKQTLDAEEGEINLRKKLMKSMEKKIK